MVAIHKPAHDIILKPVVSEKSYAPVRSRSVHLRGGPEREQGSDQAGNRRDLQCQGDERQHPQPRRQAPAPATVSASASIRSAPS